MKKSVMMFAFLPLIFSVAEPIRQKGVPFDNHLLSVRKLSNLTNLTKEKIAFAFPSDSASTEKLYYLYNEKNEYEGYYLLNSDNIITMVYNGSFRPKCKSDLSYLPSRVSKCEEKRRMVQSAQKASVSPNKLLCNPTYLFKSEIYSQSAQRYIMNCPEYFNDVPGYYNMACAAVSGARMISFYDRYSSYDLVDGLLPLNQEDNENAVHNLAKELITEMKTSPTGATSLFNEQQGLKSYLNKHNGSSIRVNSNSGFEAYQDWILSSNNPVLLNFLRSDGQMGHAVLGIGFASIRNGNSRQNYYIVHYNSPDHSQKGNYIFNDANYYMNNYLYLTK